MMRDDKPYRLATSERQTDRQTNIIIDKSPLPLTLTYVLAIGSRAASIK